ncbi:ABC-F family ATP-binding cassette domain-containing protein [Desulforhopalus singaporensis]|uniref:ATP-binding cassette, subfamily F, uup n=1 Tax=Desulforhopalus singaporensis TaxID=91360 RepID=A0A1H0K312_9BACT|nr:ABC-F family ATP-binding cassette domain-containing protein [Desulforhopalus singaporensis]SDO50306.1 ATP-binding cassette, subfamily F, uup [Desulforhopalus singaporensis]
MSNLLTCKSLSKSFGAQKLFADINFTVHLRDRIGVIGPNGSGKSTLLKIVCDLEEPDGGEVVCQKFVRKSYLAQDDLFDDDSTIFDNLLEPLKKEPIEDVEKYSRIQSLLSRAGFVDPAVKVGVLSGGWRKRLAICRMMLTEPDILVMDEPTNHLDIEGILWLEKMLEQQKSACSYLLVSHDRRFLENCTNRIIELSAVYPEGIFQVDGPYSKFVEAREKFLAGQQQQEERLANKARREIEWLRRGPKARSTKAKYRIDEAHKLTGDLAEVKARNRALANVQIDFAATGRKTKKLLEAKQLSKAYGDKSLFSGLDITLSPGSRLGLLGRNGCGKSTLMKILAGVAQKTGVAPDSGTLTGADGVRVVSFEQNRETIDPDVTLRRALAPDGDSIVFRDRSLHVVSWARKFLFRPDQLETPVGQLSGGEQARILIASLMRQPADILLLDEPTNDLDISSLDVLEASLTEFPGALVLVTHDRFLLDRVCHRILGFGGAGGVAYYADYEQWIDDLEPERKNDESADKTKEQLQPKAKKIVGRLSYMDQREYDQIEDRISDAESTVEELQRQMELPEVMADAAELEQCWVKLEQAQGEVERLYSRWDELEAKKGEQA